MRALPVVIAVVLAAPAAAQDRPPTRAEDLATLGTLATAACPSCLGVAMEPAILRGRIVLGRPRTLRVRVQPGKCYQPIVTAPVEAPTVSVRVSLIDPRNVDGDALAVAGAEGTRAIGPHCPTTPGRLLLRAELQYSGRGLIAGRGVPSLPFAAGVVSWSGGVAGAPRVTVDVGALEAIDDRPANADRGMDVDRELAATPLQDALSSVVAARRAELIACYGALRPPRPPYAGVRFRFRLRDDGRVADVTVIHESSGAAGLGRCVARRFRGLVATAARGGAGWWTVEVSARVRMP